MRRPAGGAAVGGQTRVLPAARGSPLPLTCCPALAFSRGQGRGRLWAGAAGIPPLPKTHLPGGQPQIPGELAGSSLARQHQPGATRVRAGEGRGLPWKG